MLKLTKLFWNYSKLKSEVLLTNKCSEILHKKKQSNNSKFLRLTIEAGEGCEGFKYKFLFDDALNNSDVVYQTDKGVQFAIEKECLDLVGGCTIDYQDKMMRQGFFVKQNPNAQASCSCKVSFSPKQVPAQK